VIAHHLNIILGWLDCDHFRINIFLIKFLCAFLICLFKKKTYLILKNLNLIVLDTIILSLKNSLSLIWFTKIKYTSYFTCNKNNFFTFHIFYSLKVEETKILEKNIFFKSITST